MIYVGTSGFAYKQWKGLFYPEKLPQKDYLSHYAETFPTTEVNNTFYRSPSTKVTAGWNEKTPDDFRFTLKLNQRITHKQRLAEVDESMEWFLQGAAELGGKLGCILVQTPPWFRRDDDRLGDFVERFGHRAPLAFEFRHESWFDPAVYDLFRTLRQTLVVAETDKRAADRQVTGPFAYVRLRKTDYPPDALQDWANWLGALDGDAYVYFKHEKQAPVLAQDLMSRLKG